MLSAAASVEVGDPLFTLTSSGGSAILTAISIMGYIIKWETADPDYCWH